MEKFKALIKFLWLPLVAFALWIVYKLFISEEDKPLNVTTDNSGLSSADIELYNQVVVNLSLGGDPYDWTNIFVPLQGSNYAQNAVKLGDLLSKVENKSLFAYVYAKKNNSLLTTAIIETYGSKVYQLISQNVPNFGDFIL